MVMLRLTVLLALGGRHQLELVMDTGRALFNVRNHWHSNILQLHTFVAAVSRVAVNHDGRSGSAPDPLAWDQGSRRKQRWLDIRVNIDLASLPGPHGFLKGPWVQVHGGCSLVLM